MRAENCPYRRRIISMQFIKNKDFDPVPANQLFYRFFKIRCSIVCGFNAKISLENGHTNGYFNGKISLQRVRNRDESIFYFRS
jgi:hypothetical protein